VIANILAEGMKIDIIVLSHALYHPAIRKISQTEGVSNVTLAKFTNPQSTFALSHNANGISEDSVENTT
jgi:hypothetical protein